MWKRFLVHGPADVVIRINRNHSTNTIIGAIALDWAMGRPPPYFMTVKEWWRHEQGRHSLVTRELAQIRSGVYSATSLRKASALSLCADWVGLLRLQRWIDPVGWAARGEESYCLIDRRITRKQRDLKQATTVAVECNYRLCRFRQYEAGLLRLGLPIPRKMERKLRWTGHFRVFRNGGYSQLAQIAAGGPTGNGS